MEPGLNWFSTGCNMEAESVLAVARRIIHDDGIVVTSCSQTFDGSTCVRFRLASGDAAALPGICQQMAERLPLTKINLTLNKLDGQREIAATVGTPEIECRTAWAAVGQISYRIETAVTLLLALTVFCYILGWF